MSTSNQSWRFPEPVSFLAGTDIEKWFAVQTRARHEKVVAQRLSDKGVGTFLPLIKQVHRWSDRQKTVELPLFGCYVFVKLAPMNQERQRVNLACRSRFYDAGLRRGAVRKE